MEEERFITETEKKLNRRRRDKGTSPDQVFSLCRIKVLSEVYKTCGGRAVILYAALVGNSYVLGTDQPFQLLNSFLTATGLTKSDMSKSTGKLEGAGYITVTREAGHKNRYQLTEKGRQGLVRPR